MKTESIETPPDAFHWLGEINKASAVMVAEQAIVPASLGAHIAEAIAEVIAAGQQPNAPRPAGRSARRGDTGRGDEWADRGHVTGRHHPAVCADASLVNPAPG